MKITPTRPAPQPFACPECLRRGHLLGQLAPYLEKVAIERSGVPVHDLLCLNNEDLVRSTAPGLAERLLGEYAAVHGSPLISRLKAGGCWACCRHDPLYPESLWDAADAPWCLYGRGDATLLVNLAERKGVVTVVGARRASSYGREVARNLGRDLAAAGMTVVSGMAFGIDACAHRGALEAGQTIAVLDSGADVAYPASHRSLWRRIHENGLVLSELPPGTGAWRWAFRVRNRIMAAMAAMTVVVEAAEESESLGTAEAAADLGRDVGAVPGPVNSRVSSGTNLLLSEGACVVRSRQDVLDVILGTGATRTGTGAAASGGYGRLREMRCPNCGQEHRGISACLLGAILGVIEDRGELRTKTITPARVAGIDVNGFWEHVGPATDWVEEQLLALGAEEATVR